MGSMETTPTETLEVALCQSPLGLAAIEIAGLTAYRLNVRKNGGKRAGSFKVRVPPETPFHIKKG